MSSFHISTVESLSVFQSRVLLNSGEVNESPKQEGAVWTENSLKPVTVWVHTVDGSPSRMAKASMNVFISCLSRGIWWESVCNVLMLDPSRRARHSEPPSLSLRKNSLSQMKVIDLQSLTSNGREEGDTKLFLLLLCHNISYVNY